MSYNPSATSASEPSYSDYSIISKYLGLIPTYENIA